MLFREKIRIYDFSWVPKVDWFSFWHFLVAKLQIFVILNTLKKHHRRAISQPQIPQGIFTDHSVHFPNFRLFQNRSQTQSFSVFLANKYFIKVLRGSINCNYDVPFRVGIIPIKRGVHVTMLLTPCPSKCDGVSRCSPSLPRARLAVANNRWPSSLQCSGQKLGLIWFSGLTHGPHNWTK